MNSLLSTFCLEAASNAQVMYFICAVLLASSLGKGLCLTEPTSKGKIFSIFNIVKFTNTFCQGSGNRIGTCYTVEECESRGGIKSGNCASGFGLCCVISISCGGTSSDNCTYMDQGVFTNVDTLDSNPCSYSICPNNIMICRIRLDFTSFQIASPFTTMVSTVANVRANTEGGATGDCTVDSFTFNSPGNVGAPVICGLNTGQHMILDASSTCNVLSFNIGATSSISRSWSIKVTQYTCGDHDYQGGPPGCLQYFTGSSGEFASYNYPTQSSMAPLDSSHLSSQCYTFCFRQEVGKCSICYGSAIMNANSFGLSKTPAAVAKNAIDNECKSDYLQIPFGVPVGMAVGIASPTQKFCGRFLNPTNGQTVEASVCSFAVPFTVVFKSDEDELCVNVANGMTCEASKVPGGTIGFHLKYLQKACP